MYNTIVSDLRIRGVKFEEGLSLKEIEVIQQKYGITFPESLSMFYQKVLPISQGFYNWRDFSEKNILYIQNAMEKPLKDIIENLTEVDWCEVWGNEPIKLEERNQLIQKRVYEAPKLIPIFSHRYMANVQVPINPVFSICGTDIIYFAKDLLSYLEIEFELKGYEQVMTKEVSHIPFWSELL